MSKGTIAITQKAKRVITYSPDGNANGTLLELWKDGGKTTAYLTTIIPGGFKGYHLHNVRAARYILLKGRVKIILYQDGVREEHILEPDMRMYIPPLVATGLLNIGDEEVQLLNYPDPAYDPELKGEQVEFTEEELEATLK